MSNPTCAIRRAAVRSRSFVHFPLSIMPKENPGADDSTESKSSPATTFRNRGISASVFENTSDKDRTYFSVSIQKRYKDKEGNWQNSSNFLRDELPVLEHVVRQAFAFILEQEANRPTQAQEE